MVWHNVFGLVKPPGAGLVQHLPLEGNGGEDAVKRALAIGGDQNHFVGELVRVADFTDTLCADFKIG